MFTKTELLKQLKAMNVPQDRVITLHSSLRAVGQTENGADGLLDALIEHCTSGGGLLTIPTHTWGISPEPYKFDGILRKTNLGVLSAVALNRKDAHLSQNPTHSMAVFGENEKAEEFISGEQFVPTGTHPTSCYGKLYERDGLIMLVGVNQTKNTFIHCVEEMLGVPNRLSKEKHRIVMRLNDGSRFDTAIQYVEAEGIDDVSMHFGKLEAAFNCFGAISYGKLGNAEVQLCSAVKIYDCMRVIFSRSRGQELLADDLPLDDALYK